MPIASLYGDVVTITLSSKELMSIMNNGEMLIPGDGLPAPSRIRIVQEGHHEAHRSSPTAMYHVGYHNDATTPEMNAAFKAIAEELFKRFKPARALDLGCSAGTLVKHLKAMGVEAWGVDGSEAAHAVNPAVLVHDLRNPNGLPWEAGTFDLVTSFDTAEHIEQEKVHVIAELAAGAAKRGGWVVFGAATPGQGGLGHVTLRSHHWWRDLLESYGLKFDEGCTRILRAMIKSRPESDHAWWVQANLQVFQKS